VHGYQQGKIVVGRMMCKFKHEEEKLRNLGAVRKEEGARSVE
jgi:hypothetical protein